MNHVQSIFIIKDHSNVDSNVTEVLQTKVTWQALLENILAIKGLDRINLSVSELLQQELLDSENKTDPKVSKTFQDLALFLILNRGFCSPTMPKAHGLYQAGIVRLPIDLKYVRSEFGTAAYGVAYDRHTVLIRKRMEESFIDTCSKYITPNPKAKRIDHGRMYIENTSCLADSAKENFHVVDLYNLDQFIHLYTAIKNLSQSHNPIIYLRSNESILESQKKLLDDVIKRSKNDITILIQEPFIVDNRLVEDVLKVSMLHRGEYKFRYQALQDVASLGYRPHPSILVNHLLRVGTLCDHLVSSIPSVHEITSHRIQKVTLERSDLDEKERIEDFTLLKKVLDAAENRLPKNITNSIHIKVVELLSDEINRLNIIVNYQLTTDDRDLKQMSIDFYEVRSNLRTLIQYVSYISSKENKQDDLISNWADLDTRGVISTNSGMSAANNTLLTLADKVSFVLTSEHYWEVDFLVNNVFKGNPHFDKNDNESDENFVHLKTNLSPSEIQKLCDMIITQDKYFSKGQLLCLDSTISPFFYTKIFPLKELIHTLTKLQMKFENPVYLVTDTTLDFFQTNVASLFPNGIPENLYFIEVISHAKLHQLGFDAVTGGMIRVHSCQASKEHASQIYSDIAKRVSDEDSGQSFYGETLIDTLFYDSKRKGFEAEILNYMVTRRQRSGRIFFEEVLNTLLKNSVVQERDITIQNPNYPEKKHLIKMNVHYEPLSALHVYVKVSEDSSDIYIAATIFEQIKSRFLERCYNEGYIAGDGTSWGFRNIRMDWYMHTLRVAIGIEHPETAKRMGEILGDILSEFNDNPDVFVNGRSSKLLSYHIVKDHEEKINYLLQQIPHDSKRFLGIKELLKEHPEADKYSYLIIENGYPMALIFAYPIVNVDGERVLYISKAVTDEKIRGKGFFKLLLQQVEDRAERFSFNTLLLHTSASERNSKVVQRYQKYGFQIDEEFDISWLSDGWPLIQVTMRKYLNQVPKVQDLFQGLSAEYYLSQKEQLQLLDRG